MTEEVMHCSLRNKQKQAWDFTRISTQIRGAQCN